MSELRGQSVLVTGGAGFIGSHLLEALVQVGAHVTVQDTRATPDHPNLASVPGAVRLIAEDTQSAIASGSLDLQSFTLVFHLSGNAYVPASVEQPAVDFQKNLQTTFDLLEALRQQSQKPRLIFASSAAVYGNPTHLPIHEEDCTNPISPYGVSKLAAERYVEVYARLYGIPAATVRMFSVYGSRQRKLVVYDLLHKLRSNPSRLEVYGDGTQERDFCSVTDAVQAMLTVAKYAPAQGEIYNVASGEAHSINELVALWCEILGVSPQIVYSGDVRAGVPQRWSVSIERLRSLGFTPQISLEAGLRTVKEWYDATH